MMAAHRSSGNHSPEDALDTALQRFRAGDPPEHDPLGESEQELFEESEAGDPGVPRTGLQKIARTPGQARYLEAMEKNDIVMALGPAGTGKTYLAVRAAVESLKSGEVRKLILTRPAVEAGEKLGFLPGDFQQK